MMLRQKLQKPEGRPSQPARSDLCASLRTTASHQSRYSQTDPLLEERDLGLTDCPDDSRQSTPRRDGFLLLEVMVALLILSVALLAIVSLVVENDRTMSRSYHTEDQIAAADNFLQHVGFWNRHELEVRIGNHEQGAWRLQIDRLTERLFRVTLYDSSESRVPTLQTVLYRPDSPDRSPISRSTY